VGLGAAGLLAELLLLEHWSATPQLTPLVTLTLVLGATAAVVGRQNHRTLGTFRVVMAWAVLAGLAGIAFHLRDNLLFEQEIAPDASLLSLTWRALRGATPLLAPGSLVQLGLVGLAFTYHHPGLHGRDERREQEQPERDQENLKEKEFA